MPSINEEVKSNGRTLIHYAADYGQKEVCEYLIQHGADINVCDKILIFSNSGSG